MNLMWTLAFSLIVATSLLGTFFHLIFFPAMEKLKSFKIYKMHYSTRKIIPRLSKKHPFFMFVSQRVRLIFLGNCLVIWIVTGIPQFLK